MMSQCPYCTPSLHKIIGGKYEICSSCKAKEANERDKTSKIAALQKRVDFLESQISGIIKSALESSSFKEFVDTLCRNTKEW